METGIKYEKEFASKQFVGKSQKDAYMQGMKWYATNVLAKNELKRVQFSVEKVNETTITLHMYVVLGEAEARKQHCSICKAMHYKIYLDNNCNCAWCNVHAYQRRLDDTIRTAVNYCKEKLAPYL